MRGGGGGGDGVALIEFVGGVGPVEMSEVCFMGSFWVHVGTLF